MPRVLVVPAAVVGTTALRSMATFFISTGTADGAGAKEVGATVERPEVAAPVLLPRLLPPVMARLHGEACAIRSVMLRAAGRLPVPLMAPLSAYVAALGSKGGGGGGAPPSHPDPLHRPVASGR